MADHKELLEQLEKVYSIIIEPDSVDKVLEVYGFSYKQLEELDTTPYRKLAELDGRVVFLNFNSVEAANILGAKIFDEKINYFFNHLTEPDYLAAITMSQERYTSTYVSPGEVKVVSSESVIPVSIDQIIDEQPISDSAVYSNPENDICGSHPIVNATSEPKYDPTAVIHPKSKTNGTKGYKPKKEPKRRKKEAAADIFNDGLLKIMSKYSLPIAAERRQEVVAEYLEDSLRWSTYGHIKFTEQTVLPFYESLAKQNSTLAFELFPDLPLIASKVNGLSSRLLRSIHRDDLARWLKNSSDVDYLVKFELEQAEKKAKREGKKVSSALKTELKETITKTLPTYQADYLMRRSRLGKRDFEEMGKHPLIDWFLFDTAADGVKYAAAALIISGTAITTYEAAKMPESERISAKQLEKLVGVNPEVHNSLVAAGHISGVASGLDQKIDQLNTQITGLKNNNTSLQDELNECNSQYSAESDDTCSESKSLQSKLDKCRAENQANRGYAHNLNKKLNDCKKHNHTPCINSKPSPKIKKTISPTDIRRTH